MNAATIRTVANSLIIGAVFGFIGGAWTFQATHSRKAVLAAGNRDDLTTNAILSSLSRIHDQCSTLEHQVSTKEPSTDPKAAAARRAALLTTLNP